MYYKIKQKKGQKLHVPNNIISKYIKKPNFSTTKENRLNLCS